MPLQIGASFEVALFMNCYVDTTLITCEQLTPQEFIVYSLLCFFLLNDNKVPFFLLYFLIKYIILIIYKEYFVQE